MPEENVLNNGFETGTLESWVVDVQDNIVEVQTLEKRTGNYGLKMENTSLAGQPATANGVYQIWARKEVKSKVSFYYKLSLTDEDVDYCYLHIYVRKDGDWHYYEEWLKLNKTDWTLWAREFEAGIEGIYFHTYANGTLGGKDVTTTAYIDDASCLEVEAEAPAPQPIQQTVSAMVTTIISLFPVIILMSVMSMIMGMIRRREGV